LRAIGFGSMGAKGSESGNRSDGEDTSGLVHDENP
jgi:hypothetical protein